MNKIQKNRRTGQALIEVLVGLFILVSGFLGIIALLAQSFSVSKTITSETQAAYLAAEGIEIAKALIDHDVYAHIAGVGTGWGTCFGNGTKFYEIDYTSTNCSNFIPYLSCAAVPDYLKYDSGTHAYSYNSGTQTPFRRCIGTQTSGNQITVDSMVMWNANGGQRSLNVEDVFYNWHP